MKKYDAVVIGAGPAGYKAAQRLRKLGKSVCIAEINDSRIGGTCQNEGCIPVKSLIEAADIYGKSVISGEIITDMKKAEVNV